MVPLIINPIYTLYSGYLLGISLFKGLGGLKQLGALHPRVFPAFSLRFTDEDVDPIDLGGLISWTPPTTLRRVQLYRVDLAISGTGALQSDERSQIGWGGNGVGVDYWMI